ncbi:MAG: hypothetical protein HYS51_00375 [Candidatus Zambryskibacteria bacterium]|nr:hypothetical protein [Candidatus Zambryskibacteria bacterium]
MKKNWEQLISDAHEPIGEGAEKKVYQSRHHPERVLGAYKHPESPGLVKARYYLTKILHILLPENIVDIHLSSSQPNAVVREKVKLDDLYTELQKIYVKAEWSDEDERRLRELEKQARERQYYDEHDLIQNLHNLGIAIDEGTDNFAYDTADKLKYFEDFPALKIEKDAVKRCFNETALQSAIGKITDDKSKEKAQSYLNRLMHLIAVEEAEINQK